MEELSVKFRTVRRKMFDLPEIFSEGRKKREIAFILRHKDDPRFLLPGICVVDFPSGEARYFLPFSKEAAETVSRFLENVGIPADRMLDAHSIAPSGNGTYLVSFQLGGAYLLEYDPINENCRFLFPETLGLSKGVAELGAMGFFSEKKGYCYLANGENRNSDRGELGAFASGMPFFHVPECIFEGLGEFETLPHSFVPVPQKNAMFLLSDASAGRFRFCTESVRNVEKIYALSGIKQKIFRQLFQDFAASRNLSFSDEAFLAAGSVTPKGYEPSGDFLEHIATVFKKTGCRTLKEYADYAETPFVALPGEFSVVESCSMSVSRYRTSWANAAHFVFSESGQCFVSSHNFTHFMNGTVEYFGPAAIDRFEIRDDGSFEKKGTFSTSTGYRFASHRVFKDPEYGEVLVTSGAPGRIFFIRTDTMEEIFHFDAYPNRLDECPENPSWIGKYLQLEGGRPEITVRGIEKVDELGTIFFVSKREAFVYSFVERKILFHGTVSWENVPALCEYHANAAHCSLL